MVGQDEKKELMSAKIWAIFDRVIDVLAFLAAILLIFLMVTVSADVVMRYGLNRPMIWVSEITEVSLLFIAFLSTTWLLRKEGHVRIDILLGRLNLRYQGLLKLISSVIGIFVCALLVWYGGQVSLQHIQEGFRTATVLELPKGPLLMIIPIGSFLLLIQFLRSIYVYWVQWRKPLSEA